MLRMTRLFLVLLLLSLSANMASSQARRTVRSTRVLAPPKTVPKEKLPLSAKAILDSAFSDWAFKSDLPEYRDQSSPLIICDLNHDSVPDYALHVVVGKDSNHVQHFIALVSSSLSFQLYDLQTFTHGQWDYNLYYQEIFKRGIEFDRPPFESEGDNRKAFPTDCISISMHEKNSCTVYLFEHGAFKQFSPCD